MERKWNIRAYREGDEEGILELWKAVYPLKQFERGQWMRWWKWRYKENPAGTAEICIAEHNGKIVGQYAVIPTLMKIGTETVMTAHSLDTMTHPNYTRQGMFTMLANKVYSDAAEHGISIVHGFPNRTSHPGFVGKLSWFDVAPRQIWVKPFHWRNAIELQVKNRFVSTFLAVGAALVFNKVFIRTRKVPILEGITINQISSFDDRINTFWDKISGQYQIISVRDKDYLNWRYGAVPDVTYSIYIAEKAGGICGYLVSRVMQWDNTRLGVIFDVLTESVEIAHCLLSRAVEQFEYDKADSAFCRMIDRKTVPQALKNSGFISIPFMKVMKEVPFGIRSCSPHITDEFLKDHQNWFIQVGDSDWI